MTNALIQSMKILQLSQLELFELLLEEVERNPLLELTFPSSSPLKVSEQEIEDAPSLHDHLQAQIREAFVNPIDLEMAETLLHRLDEKGYLEPPIPAGCEKVLSILQTFDPPGIFSTSLQECLLNQLKLQNLTHSSTYRLIQDHFSDLLQGRYSTISKKVDLRVAIKKISQLSFRPASSFQKEPSPLIFPDLIISQVDNQWKIEIPEKFLPQFKIVEYELNNVKEEEKQCVREWRAAAKWLSRCVKRRTQVLLQIGAYLVQKQSSYLSHKKGLHSLSMKEIAQNLALHESTISRALNGKYAATPIGIIALRSLLTQTPEVRSAKEMLKQLIQNEETPLSDAELTERLTQKGIFLSRRTVAKYRKQLKIGPARGRLYFSPKDAPK